MADRVRAYDWATTALGPIGSWSKELVTIVNLTLASASPTRAMWGPELILIYNDAYRPFPGPRHPSALGKPAREVYGESWHVVGPLLGKALSTGQTVFHEKLLVPLPTGDGVRNAYLNYSFIPVLEDGKIAGLFGAVHDVTSEVAALRKLAENEARVTRILQSIGDAVIVTDHQGLITEMNHVAENLTGWHLGEARGQLLSNVFSIIDEERRQIVESPADKVRRLGTVVGLANHTLLIRKDGTEIAIDDSGAPIVDDDGNLVGVVLVFRDIAERKQAEKAALRERMRLLEAFQQAPILFALLQGPDHVFTMVNPPYLRLMNYPELLNKPVRMALPDAAESGLLEILDSVYQGKPFVGNGLRYRSHAGEGLAPVERYVDFAYQPLLEADGSVSGIIVVGVDVTDRRKAQGALRHLGAIVDSSDDVILSKDLNGIVTSWNAAASRLFGYSAEEMVGSSILKLIPTHLHSEEATIIESIRAGRRVEHFETVRLTRDGQTIDVSLTISPVMDEQGNVVGASKILRDVSDRKRMEQSLLQAEKIAAVGRMAATVAHEINNPLEAVMNLLFLLRPKVTDIEGQQYLATAENELGRVSHIARQTLGYHREHAAATLSSLNDIAQQAVEVYKPRCTNAGIEIEAALGSLRKMVLRRGEMMQVISNLILNSIYAMPNGGRLSLSVEDTDEPACGTTLKVSDNGIGIPQQQLPRVFDAFFTTRSTVGTGIGLFVAKGFIEGHGGRISITSQTDANSHGTTVSIFLPVRTSYQVAQNE